MSMTVEPGLAERTAPTAEQLLMYSSGGDEAWRHQVGAIFDDLDAPYLPDDISPSRQDLSDLLCEKAKQIALACNAADDESYESQLLVGQAINLTSLAEMAGMDLDAELDKFVAKDKDSPAEQDRDIDDDNAAAEPSEPGDPDHPAWLSKSRFSYKRGMATVALTAAMTTGAFAATSGASASAATLGANSSVTYSKVVSGIKTAGNTDTKTGLDLSFLNNSGSQVSGTTTPSPEAASPNGGPDNENVSGNGDPKDDALDLSFLNNSGSQVSGTTTPSPEAASPNDDDSDNSGDNSKTTDPDLSFLTGSSAKPTPKSSPSSQAPPPTKKSTEPSAKPKHKPKSKPAPKKTPNLSPAAANRQNFVPVFKLIASHEGANNYNAYFGHGDNHSIDFTSMTIAQVLQWQTAYRNEGNASNAVGLYQFMGTTLATLCKAYDVPLDTKFTADVQDGLAIDLMKYQGHLDSYLNGSISDRQMAHNLATIWAAFPSVTGANPNQSVYAGDGLNRGSVSVSELLSAVHAIKDTSVNNPPASQPTSKPKAKPKKSVPVYKDVKGFPSTANLSCPDGSTDEGLETTSLGNTIRLCKVGGAIVNASMAEQTVAMFAAARAAGYNLTVNSSYRPKEEQIELRKQHCGTSYYDIYKKPPAVYSWQKPPQYCDINVQIPGLSLHEQAEALDLSYNGVSLNTSMPAYQWLASYAQKTGVWWSLANYSDALHWQDRPPSIDYTKTPNPYMKSLATEKATESDHSTEPKSSTESSDKSKPSAGSSDSASNGNSNGNGGGSGSSDGGSLDFLSSSGSSTTGSTESGGSTNSGSETTAPSSDPSNGSGSDSGLDFLSDSGSSTSGDTSASSDEQPSQPTAPDSGSDGKHDQTGSSSDDSSTTPDYSQSTTGDSSFSSSTNNDNGSSQQSSGSDDVIKSVIASIIPGL